MNPCVRRVTAHHGQVGLLGEDGVTEVGEPADAHLHARELLGGLVEHLLDFVGSRWAVVIAGVQTGQPGPVGPVLGRGEFRAILRGVEGKHA